MGTVPTSHLLASGDLESIRRSLKLALSIVDHAMGLKSENRKEKRIERPDCKTKTVR